MNTVDLEEIVRETIRKALLKEGPSRREYHAAAIDAAFDKFGPFKKGDRVANAEGDVGVVQKWDAAAEELHGKPLGPDELAVYWQKRREDTIERIEDLELAPERGSQGDRPYTAPIDPDDLHEYGETNLKGDKEMNLEEVVRDAIRRALKEREDKPLQEAEPDRSVGHHAVIDGESYVDSNFLNKLNKVSEMGALDHIGFGDFSFDSADGEKEMRFSRGGKDIPGQVGRSHSVYSHPPEFIEDVVAALESAGLLAMAEESPPDLEEKKYRREDEDEEPLDEAEEEELTPKQKKEMDKDNDGDIDDDDMDILQGKEKNEGKLPPALAKFQKGQAEAEADDDAEEEKKEGLGEGADCAKLQAEVDGLEAAGHLGSPQHQAAEAKFQDCKQGITERGRDLGSHTYGDEGLNKDLEEAPNKEWYEDQLFESLMKKWAK
jgi:hypothetical protein